MSIRLTPLGLCDACGDAQANAGRNAVAIDRRHDFHLGTGHNVDDACRRIGDADAVGGDDDDDAGYRAPCRRD